MSDRIPPPYPSNIPLTKGSIITSDPPSTIPFQFNPASLKRTIHPSLYGAGDGDRVAISRFSGAGVETIEFKGAVDVLDVEDRLSNAGLGVYPVLDALQLLAYPSVSDVDHYEATLASGTVYVVPPPVPRIRFVWGQQVLPVRLQQLKIDEIQYDAELKPIHATFDMSLRVLTYSDAPAGDPDYNQFLTHQKLMEQRAGLYRQ